MYSSMIFSGFTKCRKLNIILFPSLEKIGPERTRFLLVELQIYLHQFLYSLKYIEYSIIDNIKWFYIEKSKSKIFFHLKLVFEKIKFENYIVNYKNFYILNFNFIKNKNLSDFILHFVFIYEQNHLLIVYSYLINFIYY